MKKRTVVILFSTLAILVVFGLVFAHTFVFNVFGGRVQFPQEYIGANLTMEDGKNFKVFRRLKIEDKSSIDTEYTVFKVRFKFKSLKLKFNKRLSMIPVPFLVGMEGFCEKYWTFDENTDYFQGIYQWKSKAIAEKYPDSFIFKLMTKRSAPETLSYEIIPNTDLSQYIQTLSSE